MGSGSGEHIQSIQQIFFFRLKSSHPKIGCGLMGLGYKYIYQSLSIVICHQVRTLFVPRLGRVLEYLIHSTGNNNTYLPCVECSYTYWNGNYECYRRFTNFINSQQRETNHNWTSLHYFILALSPHHALPKSFSPQLAKYRASELPIPVAKRSNRSKTPGYIRTHLYIIHQAVTLDNKNTTLSEPVSSCIIRRQSCFIQRHSQVPCSPLLC